MSKFNGVTFVSPDGTCRMCEGCNKVVTVQEEDNSWYFIAGPFDRLEPLSLCSESCLRYFMTNIF